MFRISRLMSHHLKELSAEVELLKANPLIGREEGQLLVKSLNDLEQTMCDMIHIFSTEKRIEKAANKQATERSLAELTKKFEEYHDQNRKLVEAVNYIKEKKERL